MVRSMVRYHIWYFLRYVSLVNPGGLLHEYGMKRHMLNHNGFGLYLLDLKFQVGFLLGEKRCLN